MDQSMVRSSEIVKQGGDEKDEGKADPSTAFLRLGEMMQIKAANGDVKPPPQAAADEAPGPSSVPETGDPQRQAEDGMPSQTDGAGQEAVVNPHQEAETGRQEPPAVSFDTEDFGGANDLYAVAKRLMHDVKAAVTRNESPDLVPARELVDRLTPRTDMILDAHPLLMSKKDGQDYYITQPIHTMFYALKLGLHLSYSTRQLSELALCCLMQNIGMFLIPDQILDKKGALTAEEIAVIRKHPETGRKLLQPYQTDCPWLLKAVYQHHERENGQGYPLGIQGNEITECAKIIGLCDSYEAMTHSRPHRKAILQFDSIRQLIESRERQFSPQILKVFLAELTIYPIGSYVRLNNAAIGRVIATNKTQPMRPVVHLLIDGKGQRIAVEETIDLAKNNVLTIVDVVPEEDIAR